MHFFIFAITLSNRNVFSYILAYKYWNKFATKLQQNCPPAPDACFYPTL